VLVEETLSQPSLSASSIAAETLPGMHDVRSTRRVRPYLRCALRGLTVFEVLLRALLEAYLLARAAK
jgi:hypothetical protein